MSSSISSTESQGSSSNGSSMSNRSSSSNGSSMSNRSSDSSQIETKYFSFKEFQKTFNLRDKRDTFNSGGYGTIYQTVKNGENYIIKSQNNFAAFVRELSILRSIEHTNIIKVEGWTTDNNDFYIAQKKGISIYEAIEITELKDMGRFYENIFSKMINTISFLHKNNIVHLDIKRDNIVFFKKGDIYEPCLIDFELATYGYRYSNGLFVKPYTAYSLDNIDPEFGYKKYNSADSDYYSLGITMHKILELIVIRYQKAQGITQLHKPSLFISDLNFYNDSIFNESESMYRDMKFTKYFNVIYNFCAKVTMPLDTRKKDDFLEDVIIYTDDNKVVTTATKQIDFNCNTAYQLIVDYLNKLMLKTNVSARTAFLTYHNLHRCFDVNIKEGDLSLLKNYGKDYDVVRNLNKFALTSLYLSEIAYASNAEETNRKIDNLSSYEFDRFEIQQKAIEMIKSYGDIVVTNTLWDFANCAGSLPTFFNYTMSCDYDPIKRPKESASCNGGNKNISFFDLAKSMNGNLPTHFTNVEFTIKKEDLTAITSKDFESVKGMDNEIDSLNVLDAKEFREYAYSIIQTYRNNYSNPKYYAWIEVLYFIIGYIDSVTILTLNDSDFKRELDECSRSIFRNNRKEEKFINKLCEKYRINLQKPR